MSICFRPPKKERPVKGRYCVQATCENDEAKISLFSTARAARRAARQIIENDETVLSLCIHDFKEGGTLRAWSKANGYVH